MFCLNTTAREVFLPWLELSIGNSSHAENETNIFSATIYRAKY